MVDNLHLIILTSFLISEVHSQCIADTVSCGEGSDQCYNPAYRCDGALDCEETFLDELDCESHTCGEGEFQCGAGNCIGADKRCNHFRDCSDGSDENDCQFVCDEKKEFKCALSGKCILHSERCDGMLGCGEFDDSDETNCGGPCGDRQFHCHNSVGECISSKWRCDGEVDCPGEEDEEDCPTSVECKEGLLCDDNSRCILSTQICDQIPDCHDGTDENRSTCMAHCRMPHQWACGGQGYGYCISADFRCDGHIDCWDQSDETNCEDPPCPGGFKCTTDGKDCIPLEWRCDGYPDCSDGSDELECDRCQESEFLCRNKTCIERGLVCDGRDDCPSGADEEHCLEEGGVCEEGFQCNSTEKCLPMPLLCNQKDDCGDRSDERAGCEPWNPCSLKNGGCDHVCLRRANSTHDCSCFQGYKLAPDNNSCSDIDECSEDARELGCSQFCENSAGSYSCSCDAGYFLDINNKTCKANEVEPFLVYSNIHSMRKTDTNGDHSSILFPTHNSIIIDFDYGRRYWYWVSSQEVLTQGAREYETVLKRRLFNETDGDIDRVYSDSDVRLNIHDVAVDWATGFVYLVGTNESRGVISVIDTSSRRLVQIITKELDDPFRIALDPRYGVMFWTDTKSQPGKVERAAMDGTGREVLADITGWANGITIDYTRRRVIWIDRGRPDLESYAGRLEEMNYDGSGRKAIKYLPVNQARPWGISVFEDFIYWTDSDDSQEALFKCNRFDTDDTEQIRRGLQVSMAVKVVHPLRQPHAINHCAAHNCSHFCLLGAGGLPSCVCPPDLVLQNGTTCLAPSYEVVCPSCPPDVPCVRVSSAGYGCVTKNSSSTKDTSNSGGSGNKTRGHRDPDKVGTISWWIILIIVLLVLLVIIVGIVGCKKAITLSCKPCINRLIANGGQASRQDYMQISFQPTTTITTEVMSDHDPKPNRKESEI